MPEGQEGEVTGKQMIDGAVLRARRDYGAQPQLQGELLGELGRMYMRLDEIDAAVPVLDEAIASLEKHAAPGDAALNRARAYLAAAWLQTSDDMQRTGALAATGPRFLRIAGSRVRQSPGLCRQHAESGRVVLGRRRTRAGGNPANRRGFRARLRRGT